MANLEERGIPTVGVATTEFIQGAEAQAKSLGTDPALVFIPHPVQDPTDDALRRGAPPRAEGRRARAGAFLATMVNLWGRGRGVRVKGPEGRPGTARQGR